uniref:Uncharacterized protein n=1 Tax=Meloidogyne enterolobii TaxID=390850 RepID=A0A6V7YBD1_MELEN|nr:unnamed protein product [Meloidogyne enterolobii]
MAISILPDPDEKSEGIIGDLAICLNLNGILIRRSSENLLNDGYFFKFFLLRNSEILLNFVIFEIS